MFSGMHTSYNETTPKWLNLTQGDQNPRWPPISVQKVVPMSNFPCVMIKYGFMKLKRCSYEANEVLSIKQVCLSDYFLIQPCSRQKLTKLTSVMDRPLTTEKGISFFLIVLSGQFQHLRKCFRHGYFNEAIGEYHTWHYRTQNSILLPF